MEDTEIIALYLERNENAIHETDIKYHNYLFTIAHNILHDTEDSSECLDDTYVKTWNSIPPEIPKIFPAWLSKIIRNISLDLYRKKNRDKRKADTYSEALDDFANMIGTGNQPEEQFNFTLLQETINEFLQNLPLLQRNLFLCRYYYMDSLKDAAAYCDMSQAAAKSSLFRMRNDLKEYLIKKGFDL